MRNISEALPHPICPVCQDPVDCEVLGCEHCITRQDAWNKRQCFAE